LKNDFGCFLSGFERREGREDVFGFFFFFFIKKPTSKGVGNQSVVTISQRSPQSTTLYNICTQKFKKIYFFIFFVCMNEKKKEKKVYFL
jgi:hypothetical protein